MTFPVGSGSSPALKIWCRESALVAPSSLCQSGCDHSKETQLSSILLQKQLQFMVGKKPQKTKLPKQPKKEIKKPPVWKVSVLDQVPWGQKWLEWLSPQHPPRVAAHIKAAAPPPTAIRDSQTLPRSCLSPWRIGLSFCSDKEVTSELQQSPGSSLNNCVLLCLLIISPTRLLIPHVRSKWAHQLGLSKGLHLIPGFDGDTSSQSPP